MQNKPNLLDTQMNISSVSTEYYENERLCRRGQNKPKTNPISEKPKNVQMVATLVKTRNYNDEQRTMNHELLFKTNPIKPNLEKTPGAVLSR